MSLQIRRILFLTLAVLLVLTAGCGLKQPPSPAVTPEGQAESPAQAGADTPGPAPTETTPPTPTPTPEPLAAQVNGAGITVAEYEAELRQLQEAHQALGKVVSPEDQRQQVLDNLIDLELLAQGAYESGYTVDDAALQAEVERLEESLSGSGGLQGWMDRLGYSQSAFYASLRRQMAAAYQRDQIAAGVPTEAEQIRARQILTTDEDIANRALEIVKQPGINFATYAYQYDAQAGGDLGWFPRGYLTQVEVEEAAFQLQPGEISPVIKSQIGYHILQVIAREPSRALSPDARRVLQHKALEDWITARRAASQIEILLP